MIGSRVVDSRSAKVGGISVLSQKVGHALGCELCGETAVNSLYCS